MMEVRDTDTETRQSPALVTADTCLSTSSSTLTITLRGSCDPHSGQLLVRPQSYRGAKGLSTIRERKWAG